MALTEVAPGVVAWLADSPAFGSPNSVAVVEPDGITVVDAGPVPSYIEPFAAELALLEVPVRRLVHTSSHIEYVGGSTAFPLAAVYGTPEMNAHLDQPPNTLGYQHLLPRHAMELAELTTRPVSHVVNDADWISPRLVVVPVAGQIRENLVVQIPDVGLVVAGAMCSFGVTPVGFGGDPLAWVAGLDRIAELGTVVVPGHGPLGGAAELAAQQDYLRACVAADGGPLAPGPWQTWANNEFDAVNVERAARLARGDESPPRTILELMGLA